MSSVPPFKGPQPSHSPSRREEEPAPTSAQTGKDFRLPPPKLGPSKTPPKPQEKNQPSKPAEKDDTSKSKHKKDKPAARHGVDEEELQELADMRAGIKALEQQTEGSSQDRARLESVSSAATAKNVQEAAKVGALIEKMVTQMQVGKLGGKEFATMKLSEKPEVPTAFVGSNLIITADNQSITVRFDNFQSVQQEKHAIAMIEQNQEQLSKLMTNLQTKNVQLTELMIGMHRVALPGLDALPSPMQMDMGRLNLGGHQFPKDDQEKGQQQRQDPEDQEEQ